MEFHEVLSRRRMVRSFSDRPLPSPVAEAIVAAGLRGPSAGFTQGIELLVLQGPEEVARFWDVSLPLERRPRFRWPGLLKAPLLIIPFSHEQAYVDRYAEPDKALSRNFEAPWDVPYWHVDAGFSAMLILLAAVDAGLGALFFAVAEPAGLRAEFGVPDGHRPVGTIAVGYPATDDRPSSSLERGRRPPAEVVHRGRW